MTPVTNAEWTEVNAAEEAGAVSPEQLRVIQEVAAVSPRPDVRPAFGPMVSDDLGYVWLAPYLPHPDAPAPWLVVDPAGDILGEVLLPPGFELTHVGGDRLVGIVRDEMDLETVRVYALNR